jgi:hypothetical protein
MMVRPVLVGVVLAVSMVSVVGCRTGGTPGLSPTNCRGYTTGFCPYGPVNPVPSPMPPRPCRGSTPGVCPDQPQVPSPTAGCIGEKPGMCP